MKLIKNRLAGLALATGVAVSAQASVINVDGVTWDPDSSWDFGGVTATIVQSIDSTTGVLSGLGVNTTLNGIGVSSFCQNCELTLQYGGFKPTTSGLMPTLSCSMVPVLKSDIRAAG